MSARLPDVSVIVPCRGHARELEAMLAALARQTLPRERFEVIVVDDGSEPPLDLARSPAAAALRVVCLRRHAAGPAAARNAALAEARGALLVLLNADAILAPDGLERHLAAHAGDGPARAVIGRFDFLPRHRTPFVALADALGTLFPYHLLAPGTPLAFHFFWTGNLSVPARLVRAVGGFDEHFRRPLFEDIELGYRLAQAGVPLYFDPTIACDHDHAITLTGWLERAERIGWEWVTFARRHGGRPFAILDGEDEPDATLLDAVVRGLLHQHDAHAERVAALRALVDEADQRLARGDAHAAVDADLLARGATLLQGVNTIQRMRGIMAHLVGYTPEDLARHRASLRPFAVVHALAATSDVEDTRKILDLLPGGCTLVVTHRHWIAPGALPEDPRLVRVRLGAERDPWRALLDATPSEAFVLLGGRPLPTASELQALVRFLEVTPRLGVIGLGRRAGHPHHVAALAERIPTHVLAAPRKSLALASAELAGAQDAAPPPLLELLERRGLLLAVLVPAGRGD